MNILIPAILAASIGVDDIQFSRDILPILSDNCFHCHGPDAKGRKADLRLDTPEDALRKDDPVIIPKQAAMSEVFRRIVSKDANEQMPPPRSNRKLTPAQVELVRRWIDQGAPWGKHWAYEKPVRPALPKLKNPGWAKNAIDPFILARLEQEGIKPSAEARKETLIRRVTLDLTGLPPTLAEVDAFLKDSSTDAYEKVVDRLLASPRFGERMAWDWLDAARYADSNGYQGDGERTMWPWRDWVVRAFNDNMPYDRFSIEQIAGDLLPEATREQKLATAFCRNHMINGEGGRIAEENRVEYLFDQVETVSTIWLGLTMTCCRCHDHRYDPFTQKEYYGLFGIFNQTPVDGGARGGKTPPLLDFATGDQAKKRSQLQSDFDVLVKKIRTIEEKLRDAGMVKKDDQLVTTLPLVIDSSLRKGPGDRAPQNLQELIKFYKDKEPDYIKDLEALEKVRKVRDDYIKGLPQVMIMEEMPKGRDTFLLTRGAYDKKAEKVTPAVLGSLFPAKEKTQPNRLSLAQWLMDPDHPLTARVTVNRFWQTFFGVGLVKTVEDFGIQGQRPSHPELLDWLAREFVETGWDVKKLIRLFVTSATYRQSSQVSAKLNERDPENRLLARGPRFRMASWMLRDQALAASGLLVDKQGGPSVRPYQPTGIWEEATFGNIRYTQDKGENLYRRSLYTFWRRIVGPTMFFDNAARQTCTVTSLRTNTPLHALITLNDITYVEAARALAQRVLLDQKTDPQRMDQAFQSVVARKPSEQEAKILRHSLDQLRGLFSKDTAAAQKLLQVGDSPRDARLDPAEHAAWAGVCSLLLNLDETLNKQ